MSDIDVAPAAKRGPKKAAKPRSKTPANHPKYAEMIVAAVAAMKERGGSSRQKILKYVLQNYNVGKDESSVNTHLKMALKRGVTSGLLKQSKGTGASGSFKAGEKPKTAAKPKKTAKATKKVTKKPTKKSATKKAKSPVKKVKKTPTKSKKPAAKKSTPKSKKAVKPKKPVKAKATKSKAKSPAKKSKPTKAKK